MGRNTSRKRIDPLKPGEVKLGISKPKSFWCDDPVSISLSDNFLYFKPPRLSCPKEIGLFTGTEAHGRPVQQN